jgi:FkbM family methyltransferase
MASRPVDKEKRLAYFDDAENYTPYLATPAGDGVFLVKTDDKHIGRSLFGKQARGEIAVLGRAVAAISGLRGEEAVTEQGFIDIGANIGTTTVPAILTHGFASALAIEPEPENIQVLRVNLLLNRLEEQVTVLPVAVSDAVGESELVITHERGGKHWLATDQATRERKRSGRESETVTVPTVTLDHLVETGAIDAERTGLIWMDAEAHEGHILAGGTKMLEQGTPLVLEWNPSNLDQVGDLGRLQDAVAEHYTHFAGMHRNPNPNQPSFPLQTVGRLPAYAERFLDPANLAHKTDILVLRLTPEQAEGVRNLDDYVRRTAAFASDDEQLRDDDQQPGGGFFKRLLRRGETAAP